MCHVTGQAAPPPEPLHRIANELFPSYPSLRQANSCIWGQLLSQFLRVAGHRLAGGGPPEAHAGCHAIHEQVPQRAQGQGRNEEDTDTLCVPGVPLH